MNKMDKEDFDRLDREESMVKLESYIYKCAELTQDDYMKPYLTGEEVENLDKITKEQSDWLEDSDQSTTSAAFKEHLSILTTAAEPIFLRKVEAETRPKFIENFHKDLNSMNELYDKILKVQNDTDITDKEAEEFKGFISTAQEWITKKTAEQEKAGLNNNPVLLSADLELKSQEMTRQIKKFDLKRRMKIKEKSKPKGGKPGDFEMPKSKEDLEKILKGSNLTMEAFEKFLGKNKVKKDSQENPADQSDETLANEVVAESQIQAEESESSSVHPEL
jgi:hypoxia up-regulated 1